MASDEEPDDEPNPRVFLDVEIAEWGEAGRIEMELFFQSDFSSAPSLFSFL